MTLRAYQRVRDLFNACSLDETELAVVRITVGRDYRCPYTVQAHLHIAARKGVRDAVLRALASGNPLPNLRSSVK